MYSPILEKLIKSAVESGAGTETEVRQLFSDILALGTVDKFTHLSTEWEWENKKLWDSIISKTKKGLTEEIIETTKNSRDLLITIFLFGITSGLGVML